MIDGVQHDCALHPHLSERFARPLRLLNRLYAILASLATTTLYCVLWLFFRGAPPHLHTRPHVVRNATGAQVHISPAVLVTRAHEPVGRATALALARAGWTAFAGVPPGAHAAALEHAFHAGTDTHGHQLPAAVGGALHVLVCDPDDVASVADAARRVQAFDEANGEVRPFVGVVNVAPPSVLGPAETMARPEIERMIQSGLVSCIDVTRAFLPLLKQHHGRVVNVLPQGVYRPLPGWTMDSAVKAALEALTRAWNYEARTSRNVHMAAVRPGWLRSGTGDELRQLPVEGAPSLANGDRQAGDKDGEQSGARTPLRAALAAHRRMMAVWARVVAAETTLGATPEDVARTVCAAFRDPWLHAVYAVTADALLGDVVRSMVPEPIAEYVIVKTML